MKQNPAGFKMVFKNDNFSLAVTSKRGVKFRLPLCHLYFFCLIFGFFLTGDPATLWRRSWYGEASKTIMNVYLHSVCDLESLTSRCLGNGRAM